MTNNKYYTQRDWDRTVGYGQVPYKYSLTAKIMEDTRAKMIQDNEKTYKLYSEHYGVDDYMDRYANVYRDMTYWRVDMHDKNDLSQVKIKYYEEETNADSAAENWCLGYAE